MRRLFFLLLSLSIVSLAACGLLDSSTPDSSTAVTPEAQATPTNTPAPAITPDVAISTNLTNTTTTLTIWIPPELWQASESGQATLLTQIDSYRAAHPELTISIEPKAISGQGSILNYLRTGRTIAPDILPDLIALPSEQLSTAFSEELIYTLDGFVPAPVFEDVFPAGISLTKFGDQTIGYPFVLNQPPHLAYNTAVFTSTIPLTWEEFSTLPEQSFVFPAAGTAGATLLLEIYLDEGGTLMNEAGQFELQLQPLVNSLQKLSDGRENMFILANSSNIETLTDSWQIFQTGNATFVQTNAEQFLRRQPEIETVIAGPIPGQTDSLTPLVSGWAWAISSTDSAKRPLISDLITYLVDTPNLGEWSRESQLLPARQGALFFWPEDDPYVLFASDMLLEAEAHPFPPNHPVMLALSDAVFDVVSLSKSPQVAAEEAIATLQE